MAYTLYMPSTIIYNRSPQIIRIESIPSMLKVIINHYQDIVSYHPAPDETAQRAYSRCSS